MNKMRKDKLLQILFFTIILIVLLFFNNPIHALCVNSPEANLRSGPGTKYEKTWEIFKYMPLKEISKKGNWYKVKDVDSDIHWIYRKLVTNKFRCAVVKGENIAIRKGPGTSFEKTYFSPAMRYDPFKIMQVKGSWVNVVDEFGNAGWIYKKLLWIQ